ncbi:MAG: UPF0147 family protein [Ignisphaera sp.]
MVAESSQQKEGGSSGSNIQKRFESRIPQYDNEAKIRQALLILNRVMNDPSIPRNIRRAAMYAIRALNEKNLTAGVRAANAVGVLDEVSQDPNMPLHARTLLWQAISILETVKD